MSRTDEYINQLYEAGLVDRFGNRLYPDLHHHGDRQPVQGANGDRINPSDVLGQERFLERRAAKMDEKQPVALWYRGRCYHKHPGWRYLYKEVSRDGDKDYKPAPVEDGEKVQRWLVAHGYRVIYQKKGNGSATDFVQCWMHERYAGSGEEPGDFHPESLAQLREYIALAVAKRDEPEEDTVAPELPEQEATVQPEPEHMPFDTAVDKIAAFVGNLVTASAMAGWLA